MSNECSKKEIAGMPELAYPLSLLFEVDYFFMNLISSCLSGEMAM